MKRYIEIFALLLAILSVAAVAQEPVPDSLASQGITFNGIVQDSSFAAGEKLNVEILESGEALQTTVGTPFSIVLPEDTLWNVCVTNSDTAGAEKEKCYELKYIGAERSFSQALGEAFVQDERRETKDERDSTEEGEGLPLAAAADTASTTPSSVVDTPQRPDTLAQDSASQDVDVDALLAGGDNAKVTELKKVVVQLRRRPKRKPGESVVSAKSIKRMPSLAEADVIKSIQALPGVVASSDFSSKIYVRGGPVRQRRRLFAGAFLRTFQYVPCRRY